MTRLSSYSIYVLIFIIPAAVIGITIAIITDNSSARPFYFTFFLLPLSIWSYIIYKSKRVFYKDSELYLFSLFSNKVEVVKKDQGISIEKWNWSLFRDTGTYRLTYWFTNDKVKSVWFSVNGLLDNPDEIIDKINSL